MQDLVARVLVALFNADSFAPRNAYTIDHDIFEGRHEGVMSPCFFVVFTDGFPVVDIKSVLAHDFISVNETVDNELVGNVVAIVIGVVHSFCVFARIDADEHGVTRLHDFSKPCQEWRYLVTLEVSET